MSELPRWATVTEAIEIARNRGYKVSGRTIRQWADDKEINADRRSSGWLIDVQSLLRYLDRTRP